MDQCLLRTCEGQRTWSPRIQDQSDIIGGTSCGASWVLNIGPFFLHDLIEHKPEEEQQQVSEDTTWKVEEKEVEEAGKYATVEGVEVEPTEQTARSLDYCTQTSSSFCPQGQNYCDPVCVQIAYHYHYHVSTSICYVCV